MKAASGFDDGKTRLGSSSPYVQLAGCLECTPWTGTCRVRRAPKEAPVQEPTGRGGAYNGRQRALNST